jgi:hypothetical protein
MSENKHYYNPFVRHCQDSQAWATLTALTEDGYR